MDDNFTIAEASRWASQYCQRDVSKSNIAYLITYGKIRSVIRNGAVMLSRQELQNYFDQERSKQAEAMQKLSQSVNPRLAFDEYREKERTKHVHRLHPYKGKFIPQLVEYFLDTHTDEYKRTVFFQPGDIVLDPFCGSGTTLVQAAELGLHALGIDVSTFNTLISNTKAGNHDLLAVTQCIREISRKLMAYYAENGLRDFDEALCHHLARFNARHFPSPEFKLRVRRKELNHYEYGRGKAKQFEPVYFALLKQFDVQINSAGAAFLDKWYMPSIRAEIKYLSELIENIEDVDIRNTVWMMLSRTIRSTRATAHIDLATLKEPVFSTYYCRKHMKICKPLFTLTEWWKRYTDDTIRRFAQFDNLKTDTFQIALTGDSREIPIMSLLQRKNPTLANLIREKKIAGIFTSPPYVGMIDYHEQHAYAYELMGIERRDADEIGPLFKGKGKAARQSYVQGIAAALNHCKSFLMDDYNVFLVANDKFSLYEEIASLAAMQIINRFHRPVLRRSEFDQSAYYETIFHLKEGARH